MTTESPHATATPAPIPVPPDFPVTWERPEDELLSWQQDRMHFPEPSTPLMEAFLRSFNDGFERASKASDVPIRLTNRRLNTYIYSAMLFTVPPEEMEAKGQRAAQKVGANMARLQEWWDTELLPEIKQHLAWWEAFDREEATTPELLTHLEETLAKLTRLWEIHFLIAFPFLAGPSMFADVYQDLFQPEGALDPYRLLQGFGNKTVDGGHALWALSRKALASPQVRQVLEENDPAGVPAALKASDEGRAFLKELDDYLEEYGQRSDVFAELGSQHWIENPATAIKNLKDFVSQPDRDLATELRALAEERERLIAEAREQLKGYPQAAVEQFEFLLKAAQSGTIIQEDHNYWIDQRATYKVRRVLLEFGRRFSEAGVIEQVDDVFYLTMDELLETASALPSGDRRQLVTERRAEMEHFRGIQAPPALGTPPAELPPDNPLTRAFARFAGEPPEQSTEAGVLRGNACSPGKVTGTARVVPSLAEAGKLRPGDLLIAPATMPAWTPLFASIAAVVTDAGGVLSHAAIVAREYNIPAVLGTGNATSVIQDGQTVEVDGDSGVVRIIS